MTGVRAAWREVRAAGGGVGLDDGGWAPRGRMVRAAWRCGFYQVIPRAVAQSRDSGLKSFYGHCWMLRLRAA